MCILYLLGFFVNILYLFIAQNGEGWSGFPVGGGGGVGVRRLCRFCGRFAQGFGETVHILGISSLGNWVKFLYFVQWLSLSFVFVSMFVICLFIIIIIGWR